VTRLTYEEWKDMQTIKRCRHVNVDHMQVLANGVLQAKWLRCLDCEHVMTTKRRPFRR
jgi:hypothetical protein